MTSGYLLFIYLFCNVSVAGWHQNGCVVVGWCSTSTKKGSSMQCTTFILTAALCNANSSGQCWSFFQLHPVHVSRNASLRSVMLLYSFCCYYCFCLFVFLHFALPKTVMSYEYVFYLLSLWCSYACCHHSELRCHKKRLFI